MNLPLNKSTIIVGAGGGGIVSALLSAKRGDKVTLLESHSALGGCASWFRRGQFIFDAGATTISGVGESEPLGELFNLIGKVPALHPSDPGIVFHLSSGQVVRFYRDFDKWMDELYRNFPHLNHRPFWEKIFLINKKSWALLRDVRTFPFRSISDLLPVFKHPEYFSLVSYLFLSTEHVLKSFGLDHPSYLELINGILLISAQANSDKIPFIVGAMALSYPAQTYAPVGGMKGLMDFFEQELNDLGVLVRKKSKVCFFEKGLVGLESGEIIAGDQIILNLPIWNLQEISKGDLKKTFEFEAKKRPEAWGAFTVYFGTAGDHTELYHQVHLNHPLVKNYFLSFSVPGDEKRAPPGLQAVTISTHVFVSEEINREVLLSVIMDDVKRRFNLKEFKFVTTGTPKTFERYTGRKNGFVGGLPFLYGMNPQSILSPLTQVEGIYRVGDTVFPGQGLCGVAAGALGLHHRLV